MNKLANCGTVDKSRTNAAGELKLSQKGYGAAEAHIRELAGVTVGQQHRKGTCCYSLGSDK